MAPPRGRVLSELGIWLFPLSILLGSALVVFVVSVCFDAADGFGHVIDLIIHPNPGSAQNTLGNAGEVVAAVLGIAITVVAIIVELASNGSRMRGLRFCGIMLLMPVNLEPGSMLIHASDR